MIIAASNNKMAIGYTTDVTTFLVPKNLFVLKPTTQVDVRFLASQILSRSVQDQMVRLVYGRGNNVTLANSWRDLVRIDIPNIEQQQKHIQDIALKDFAFAPGGHMGSVGCTTVLSAALPPVKGAVCPFQQLFKASPVLRRDRDSYAAGHLHCVF